MPASLTTRIKKALADLPDEIRPSAESCQAQLVAAGVDTVEGFRHVLLDPAADSELRAGAAWLVGLAGLEELVPDLEVLVDEKTPEVVLWEVGKSLIGLDRGQASFRRLLRQASSAGARRVAVYTLGAQRDQESVGAISVILDSAQEPVDLRGTAAEALAYLAVPESLDVLLRATRDSAAEVRFWAVFALGELGLEEARPRLLEMARDDHAVVEGWWAVSKEARDALEHLGSEGD